MKKQQKKFICYAKKWFDKINGNTYHSIIITDLNGNFITENPFSYGYGRQYEQTAIDELIKVKKIRIKKDDKQQFDWKSWDNARAKILFIGGEYVSRKKDL